MRISDWSSDVCSSDLSAARRPPAGPRRGCIAGVARPVLHPEPAGPVDPGSGGRGRTRSGGGTRRLTRHQIGRASCRERGWQDGEITGVAGTLKKKHIEIWTITQNYKSMTKDDS